MMSFLLLLILILLGHAPLVVRSLQASPRSIFVLAGQSNMAGRGGVEENSETGQNIWYGFVPHQCESNPSILRLNADLKWVEAHEPLHADIDVNKTNGVGPGMAFANTILTKDRELGPVGLVPCAIGGTKIVDWKKGSVLYNQLMRRTKAALQGGGMIKALLWYQGESDTLIQDDAVMYKQRLEEFFTNVRADLQYPMLPIFMVAVESGGTYINMVRQAQLGILLPKVHCVDAQGLLLKPGGLHLTTRSQVSLGETLARAFLKFSQTSSY
ncbi:probable carbohydrate esterase At4g34215 [Tripterygium wilfordii]|uniref:probable carbohydrate esterase At4g34215 n=1 Tax=Tripterygium wilfordii TaxID=458696 RepID=UPI0018F7F3EB|nr:probable carbohydrate esterase At4g34215 [Tripterygium wilfordii]